jgi:hypothetical protein
MAMQRYADDPWGYTTEQLRGTSWESGPPLADLVEAVRERWEAAVMPAPTWHNNRVEFCRADQRRQPHRAKVVVMWQDGVFEFQLLDAKWGRLVSADRSFAPNALAVLRAFLYQVAGDAAPERT